MSVERLSPSSAQADVSDGTTTNFQQAVLERSQQIPVLVDFWAAWCGPCRTLGPILESVVDELQGAVALVKVDCDAEPGLAEAHRVQGIPDVRLYVDGAEVDRFVGVRSAPQVKEFLAAHGGAAAPPSAAAEGVDTGRQLLEAGRLDEARQALEVALREAGDGAPDAAAARLALARVELAAAQLPQARQHLEAIPAAAPESEPAQHLTAAVAIVEDGQQEGSADDLEQRLAADDGDLDARFALGARALAAGRYEEALQTFLEVVRRDRSWRDEIGRRAMVTVFHLVGVREPLSDRYRDELRRLLY